MRQAAATDLGQIRAIVEAAYAPWIPILGQAPGPMGDDYAALIAGGFVHLPEGDPLPGLIVLIPQEDALLLDNIAVSPAAQGQGIGRQLMRFAEDQARAGGLDRLRLYTHQRMTTNIALYARAGFEETHRLEEKGFARVYMEKRL